MKIIVRYHPEFVEDYESFPEATQRLIDSTIETVRKNPLPETEGGAGKIAASSRDSSILCVRTESEGVSVVYKLIHGKGRENLLVVFAAAVGDSAFMPNYE